MHQLHNIIAIVFIKFGDSICNTIFEIIRSFCCHYNALVKAFNIIFFRFEFRIFYFNKCFWLQTKLLPKNIACPFNTMKSLFREHFQCAVRYLSLLNRIILASITLSFIWNYYLSVAFWSKCA